jgi:hypothetical protein
LTERRAPTNVIALALLAAAALPARVAQACLCASQPDECLATAPVVFEGRALTVVREAVAAGPRSLTCSEDASEPASVPPGCVVVRVVAEGCTPAADARVNLVTPGAPGPPRLAGVDADGYARFCDLPPGAYTAGAAAPAKQTAAESQRVELAPAATAGTFVRLRLQPPAHVFWRTTFAVTKSLKGGPAHARLVRVPDGECEVRFKAGVNYRVFAHKGQDGGLTTDYCSPTKPVGNTTWICGSAEWLRRKPR